MFEKFVPDIYQKNIFTINYKKLKTIGIKCIIFDLDNTLCPPSLSKPSKKVKKLFDELKNMNFKLVLVSNSPKNRVEVFKNELLVDTASFALKPMKAKYLKVMEKYNFTPDQICAIGDQLVTDIYGANRLGLTSILVNPMSSKDFVASIFNRTFEKIIFASLTKKDLFKRGSYYD